MSMDLILYFIRPDRFPARVIEADETLKLDGDYRVLGLMRDMSNYRDSDSDIPVKPTLKVKPLPDGVWLAEIDRKQGDRTHSDRWGDELTYVFAEQMKRLKLPKDVSPKNKAIFAYIGKLPNDTPIVLFWH